MDFQSAISRRLASGHQLISFVEAVIVKDFKPYRRILAIIQGSEVTVPTENLLDLWDAKSTLDFDTTHSNNVNARNGIQNKRKIIKKLKRFKKKSSSRSKAQELERAFLVLSSSTTGLHLESVVPVDARFSHTIVESHMKGVKELPFNPVKDPSDSAGGIVHLTLNSSHHKLLFEMSFSEKTESFVSEVLKAAEGVSKRKAPSAPEFSWLKPYLSPAKDTKDGNTAAAHDRIFTIGDGVLSGPSSLDSAILSKGSPVTLSTDDISQLKVDTDTCSIDSNSSTKFYDINPISRESHAHHQMSLRESQYTHNEQLNIFVGTWNVNGVAPSVGLKDYLSRDHNPPDVYALGFQELDLATEAYIFQASPREDEWRFAVTVGVHPAAKYREVACVRLVGMLLLVLVQEKHVKYVKNVQTCTVPTGLMNMLGNKGGVSARMDLYNTSVCFVNCHLAAHVEEYERRNEDYVCICEKTFFSSPGSSNVKYIKDHSHIYFFGDFNYRLSPPPHLDVRREASGPNYTSLLNVDQLLQQKLLGSVFRGYTEGTITFKPTFKYDLNTDNWDTSEKKRAPAWCDRILYTGEGIKQTFYRSHMELRISDHKPVSSLFQSQVKVIDKSKYRKVHEEVMKQLDKMENEYLPQVSLSTTEIILKPIKFLQPQTARFRIDNTGQIPVQFSFIQKLNDDTCCKPWLTVHPMSGFISPGADREVQLDILVDKRSASSLNNGSDKLYDILVLHLQGGKDFFITVTGDYERSCFGSSINALVHMNKPFSEVPVAQLIDLESVEPKNGLELPYAVPKELWYLVDHLNSHGQKAEGLFTRSGLKKEVLEVIGCLDAGVPSRDLPGSVYSVAETLLLFLDALPEPVVPFSHQPQALTAATQGFEPSKVVLNQLPDYHRNVFNYLIAFLKELLAFKEHNKLEASTLAMVFGVIFLRNPPISKDVSQLKIKNSDQDKQAFVGHFLVNDY